MINRITLINFKAFRRLELPLGPLTLLTGLNSSGKSSVLQALGLLRQSYETQMLIRARRAGGGLLLNGDLVTLGTAQDVLHEDFGPVEELPSVREPLVGFVIEEDGEQRTWAAAYDIRHPDRDVMPLAEGSVRAHLAEQPFQLPVAHPWQTDHVTLERAELVEDDEGTLEMRRDTVDVRHLSADPHLDGHLEWIRKARRESVTTGLRIWDGRTDLYPHLTFLPRVEGQLGGLNPHWVVPVRRALERLEEAVAAWDPAATAEPEWRSKVSPEGETRKRVCRFADLDGETRTFDLHARFTPGAGRIHFRLVPEERTIRLAHIGSKIRPEV
ncbi:AAA family ATPase [Streptomyces sp. TG1A-8]|uniref:AAA family ATPase n=1 Tax=Streptomyces sp. TG1A-8 TaxID=3051385 RepID=UPI00265C502C|nr:AAA family ATPase [Streptomyces sp. TG1A-8]MDO0925313.1 AAA family ATPase [Streptomyces sp. TG1A-8]